MADEEPDICIGIKGNQDKSGNATGRPGKVRDLVPFNSEKAVVLTIENTPSANCARAVADQSVITRTRSVVASLVN